MSSTSSGPASVEEFWTDEWPLGKLTDEWPLGKMTDTIKAAVKDGRQEAVRSDG